VKNPIRSTGQALSLALILTFSLPSAKAQTISNETLVTTNFVVNKTTATAKCQAAGCTASTPMLSSIPITCPAAIGKTCTFHIQLDSKIQTTFYCGGQPCGGPGPQVSFQFLVDGNPPVPGPVEGDGYYLFSKSVYTVAPAYEGEIAVTRQSYPASIVATVTNTNSNDHTLVVNLRCNNLDPVYSGCEAVAHFSTTRIDVFEP
jgi:hypothetical protein